MAKKIKKIKTSLVIFSLTISVLLGAVFGVGIVLLKAIPENMKIPGVRSSQSFAGNLDPEVITENELSIHFLELGNKYNGDCIFIKAGENDILVDAGSRSSSLPTIKSYINQYCTDNTLEYVIATHAHRDHIACFPSTSSNKGIFEEYTVRTIIDFPKHNSTSSVYTKYVTARDNEVSREGAVHYTALECFEETNGAKKVFNLTENISLEILYNYYYSATATEENNYSICFMINYTNGSDTKHFLFTGDMEAEGEEKFYEYYKPLQDANNFPTEFELYKAGHHGSKTSSSETFLNLIKPKACVVMCVAGYTEFTTVLPNTFPTDAFINRIAKHTENVYLTSMYDQTAEGQFSSFNGTIVVCVKNSLSTFYCSDNDTTLKDSAWFKKECEAGNRTLPMYWAS